MTAETAAIDPLRLLVVEDDDDTRANLVDILELDRHLVSTAKSVATALQDRDWSTIDGIILDRKLPDGSAETLLPKLREIAPQADVIIVTGFADLDGTITALRQGAADYIIKPINPEVLRATFARLAKQRRIQHALLEERRFADNILNTAEAIILLLDQSGRIVRFNPYLTELTGFQLADVRGQSWFDIFIPPREKQRMREVFQHTVRYVKTRNVLNPILDRSGCEHQIRWSNSTINDDAGNPVGVLAIGLDVTDLIRAQDKAIQSERLATIGQTMAGLAHESRNALQRIKAGIELIELDCQDRPEVLRDLARITQASEDLRSLLDEVRSYAAPIHLENQPTLIASIWRRAWESLKIRLGDRNVTVDDSRANTELKANVDAGRLERVFRNLFENSLDACPDPVEITLNCQANEKNINIVISDNGPGLPPDDKDNLFDAFFTTKADGTGLGLAITRRIIEAHDGTITAASSDSGARFIITLPATRRK